MLSLVEGVAGGVLGAVRQEDHIARSPRVVILVGPGQSGMYVCILYCTDLGGPRHSGGYRTLAFWALK